MKIETGAKFTIEFELIQEVTCGEKWMGDEIRNYRRNFWWAREVDKPEAEMILVNTDALKARF